MKNHTQPWTTTVRHRGFTIIELVIAAGMMTIVGAIVYATWSQINRHIYLQQRSTALHRECGRIINEVTNQLRCSEAVIRWDNTSITFVSSTSSDTVNYSFSGTTFEKNEQPIALIIPQTVVSSFSLENLNNEDGATPYLFQITVALQHVSGVVVTEKSTVLGRRVGQASGGNNDFVW